MKKVISIALGLMLALLVYSYGDAQGVEEFHQMWSLDAWDGHDFGLIVDGAIAAGGGVYVLDEGAYGFVLMDASGEHVAALQGKGRGPNEFEAPLSIAEDEAGQVVVLDAAHGNLRWFERRGSTFALIRSWRPPLNARDFCLFGDTIALLSASLLAASPANIHLFSRDGSILRSFGPPLEDLDVPAQALADGYIECVPERGMVLFLPDVYGEAFAFSRAGDFLWRARLPNYNQMGVEAGPGWVRYSTGPNGMTSMGAGVTVLGDFAYVQYALVDRGTPRSVEAAEVSTAVVRLANGFLARTSTTIPRLSAVNSQGLVLGFTNWPVPAVNMFSELGR